MKSWNKDLDQDELRGLIDEPSKGPRIESLMECSSPAAARSKKSVFPGAWVSL